MIIKELALRKAVRSELRKLVSEARKNRLLEQDEKTDETGGATAATIEKGLAIAFPDWADKVADLNLKSSFIDEFATLVQNAMESAAAGTLVKATSASERSAKAINK